MYVGKTDALGNKLKGNQLKPIVYGADIINNINAATDAAPISHPIEIGKLKIDESELHSDDDLSGDDITHGNVAVRDRPAVHDVNIFSSRLSGTNVNTGTLYIGVSNENKAVIDNTYGIIIGGSIEGATITGGGVNNATLTGCNIGGSPVASQQYVINQGYYRSGASPTFDKAYLNRIGFVSSASYEDSMFIGNLSRAEGAGIYILKNSTGRLFGSWETDDPITVVSDRNKKNTISEIGVKYDTLFDSLNPVTFKYNNSTSDRIHTGFIAQEVKESTEKAGLSTKDFAAYVEHKDMDGSDTCGLRYEEFISLNTWQIQKAKKRIDALEKQVKTLTNKIKKMEKMISTDEQ